MSFHWTDRDVREALGMESREDGADLEYAGISTDSRSVREGELFVALSGDRFDGHDFVPDALARGASGAVVACPVETKKPIRFYSVPDTLEALGRLAHHRRKALDIPVVGITGSSGKTTTKDLLKETLMGSLRVHATEGNFNNRIGLPLTLLKVPDGAEAVVLEMGTNEPGEIGALTAVAEPWLGVITTVSETHLEKLGSLEGVLEEKLDLLRGLPADGIAVVGDEPPILEAKARDVAPVLMVTGWSDRVSPEHRPESPTLLENGCYRFRWRGEPVELRMPGRHSVENALQALAVADVLGVPAKDAARGIGKLEGRGMRNEVRTLGTLTLLVDCYNSNPQSLRAALDLLTTLRAPDARVAVLGSMLELGEDSPDLHRRSLQEALAVPLDLVVATGLFAEAARTIDPPIPGPELVVAPDLLDAQEVLLDTLRGTEVVLLKASRGVAMEALIPSLERRFGPGRAA
jgi:UDP-N-acetylmuramoyl-tripeptide--D-alanyl-D-alanine ligase